ncbi:MAG: endonuclease III domain-containing protein [Actinomycetota bacterium]
MSPDRNSPPEVRAPNILTRLKRANPDTGIALEFSTPLECVVAVVLSAQSTDARVNLVTKDLFRKYRTPEDYLAVPEEELQADIQSTGFFRQKTRALRGLSRKLIDDFDGVVPPTIGELITLPGVARKTANIVQANCYPEALRSDPDAGIAVDTHVGRLAVRLGLTDRGPKDAAVIERDLMAVVPKRRWPEVTDLLIAHGRTICDAKRPRCGDCVVEPLCPSSQEAGLTDRYRAAMTAKKKPRRA